MTILFTQYWDVNPGDSISHVVHQPHTLNFSSRILPPTGRVEVPYLIMGMMKGL